MAFLWLHFNNMKPISLFTKIIVISTFLYVFAIFFSRSVILQPLTRTHPIVCSLARSFVAALSSSPLSDFCIENEQNEKKEKNCPWTMPKDVKSVLLYAFYTWQTCMPVVFAWVLGSCVSVGIVCVRLLCLICNSWFSYASHISLIFMSFSLSLSLIHSFARRVQKQSAMMVIYRNRVLP